MKHKCRWVLANVGCPNSPDGFPAPDNDCPKSVKGLCPKYKTKVAKSEKGE